jgi:hypothetical protein
MPSPDAARRQAAPAPADSPLHVPLLTYLLALRECDHRFDEERDRRMSEVALEREKALKIKETADLAALQLAREIQTYKDEKANELREQINRERNLYATKDDVTAAVEKMEATIRPLVEYSSSQQGKGAGLNAMWGYVIGAIGVLGILLAIYANAQH